MEDFCHEIQILLDMYWQLLLMLRPEMCNRQFRICYHIGHVSCVFIGQLRIKKTHFTSIYIRENILLKSHFSVVFSVRLNCQFFHRLHIQVRFHFQEQRILLSFIWIQTFFDRRTFHFHEHAAY